MQQCTRVWGEIWQGAAWQGWCEAPALRTWLPTHPDLIPDNQSLPIIESSEICVWVPL